MAVTSSTNKALFTGNGVTTAFSLEVKCFSTAEVKVYTKTSGVQAEVTTGITKAAITGELANGVTVTFDTAPAADVGVILIRELAETQGLELEEGGNLPAKELENALDRNTMISQQVIERFDRSIQFPVSDPEDLSYDVGTVEARANKALGFDASGNVTELDLSSTGAIGVDTAKGLAISSNVISAKVDNTTTAFSSGNIVVKDLGITAGKLAANAVTTAKILNANVTRAKIENVAAKKVLGNMGASAAAPAEVAVLDEDNMASDSAVSLATQQSIKAYVDTEVGAFFKCRAFANFDGADAAVAASGNIASITRTGTGQYTVVFDDVLASVNYTVVTGHNNGGARAESIRVSGLATTGFNIKAYVGTGGDGQGGHTLNDFTNIHFSVFQ